jgi:molybdopterin converting factor small subunit
VGSGNYSLPVEENQILHRKDAKKRKRREEEKPILLQKPLSPAYFLPFFAFFASSRCSFFILQHFGEMMKVQVKLFATLATYAPVVGLPGKPFEVEMTEGATLGDLVAQLKLPADLVKITFVNAVAQELTWALKAGDDIGIFPPIGGGSMAEIQLDVWLYGNLARYGGEADRGSFANVKMSLPEGSAMQDLLAYLKLPTTERGITFINGNLSAMVGLQPDLGHVLQDNDRVAFFHLNTMWPFQYRLGSAMISEMQDAMLASKDQGLHHTYEEK